MKKSIVPAIADTAAEIAPLANINGVYVHADTPITWLIQANPKRPSGKAHARFEAYLGTPTVQSYIDAGGTLADLKYDAAKKFLEV